MGRFAGHTGRWAGTNSFRMMPDDPFVDAAATADLTIAAAGNLTSINYTWTHHDDGPQDGLMVLGLDDDGRAIAFWGDSWHQQPAPKVLGGTADGARVVVGYEYGGGWEWRITVDATDPESLTIQMDNVIPPSEATPQIAAGPYAAMLVRLSR
jgi:hypothetical protein